MLEKVLLAGTLESLGDLKFPCLATPKVDGIRAVVRGATVVSRTLKPIRNERMRALLAQLLPEGADGEILAGGTFQDCTSEVMTMHTATYDKPFTFYWFDLFDSAEPTKPYTERVRAMQAHVAARPDVLRHPQARVVLLLPVEVRDEAGVLAFQEEALRAGHEGVMLRRPDGRYKQGRSTVREGILLKLKKFRDAEGTVVGCTAAKKAGSKQAAELGSLEVEGADGARFGVGTGFTAEMRRELWETRGTLVGRTVKFKYFEIGAKDAPRFPVFLGFRHADDCGPPPKKRGGKVQKTLQFSRVAP